MREENEFGDVLVMEEDEDDFDEGIDDEDGDEEIENEHDADTFFH